MKLFTQNSFYGGLDTELDATKTPPVSYPLLINGRARKDVVQPTNKHVKLDGPTGTYQGLYIAGNSLILFASGVAYYADISQSPIVFQTIPSWVTMSTTAKRLHAELVPTTNNFFNRYGIIELVQRTFNNNIEGVNQALFVFDGVTQPQAIFPNGSVITLGTYENWTSNKPEYVPVGSLPAIVNNKLFLASPDKTQILHSVSGRMSDFVVNIDNSGAKQGDAYTVSTSVSLNELTALKPLSSGALMASTLYASWVIQLDYDNPIFGEPYLLPIWLFPVGMVNEISSVDILEDTAFITQSGIHAFNAVAQAKKESNNFPLGAPIKGLLDNPQADTCAGAHDDYALFALNTIYGQGVVVYDTIRKVFQSLDLSFGHVKQFANTRLSGAERLFFITHQNEIYEAFAAADTNATRIYLGEWTPQDANKDTLVQSVDLIFGNVREAGNVKLTVYSDREKMEEVILPVAASGFVDNIPIPIPFTEKRSVSPVHYSLNKFVKSWKLGLLIEWDFNGELANVSVSGDVQSAPNVSGTLSTSVKNESFAVVGDTGFGSELNPGGSFSNNYLKLDVTKGKSYLYNANGNGSLISGNITVSNGIFIANQSSVAIQGTGAATFTLREITDLQAVLSALPRNDIKALIGAGNHCYNAGAQLDVTCGMLSITVPFHPVAGNREYDTLNGQFFFNKNAIPRYYSKAFEFVEFFFYNGAYITANAIVDSNGNTVGPTSEPDGNDVNSIQFAWLKQAIANSTKQFKIVVLHFPPYTTGSTYSPGYSALRLPFKDAGAHAVISAHSLTMERRIVNGFPYFVCGTGGRALESFAADTASLCAFRQNTKYGYLHIQADPLTALLSFRDTANNVLDSYSLYI